MKRIRIKCNKCSKNAVWYYMPNDSDRYFCNQHIPRGCSCNLIGDSEVEETDYKGRLYPCCEYGYSRSGFVPND